MLYHDYWIKFVDLTPSDPDGNFNALFLIRHRQSRDIVAEASSIGQALAIIREIEAESLDQQALKLMQEEGQR